MDAWLETHGGVEGLRRAIDSGRVAGRKKAEAEAWLRSHDRKGAAVTAEEERELAERSVQAAEISAKAAKASATWARWAAVVAVVAAIVSVAQYLAQR